MIERRRISSLNFPKNSARLCGLALVIAAPFVAWSLVGLGVVIWACTLKSTRAVPAVSGLAALFALAPLFYTSADSALCCLAIALAALAAGIFHASSLSPRAGEAAAALAALATTLAWNGVLAAALKGGVDLAALGATVGATTIFFLNFRGFDDRTVRACLRAPLATAATLWLALAGFWQISQREQDEYLRTLVDQGAAEVSHNLRASISEISNSMRRYALRVQYLGSRDLPYLRIDSESYLRMLPILRRIGVTDEKLNVIWSYPENLGGQVKGYNQGQEPPRKVAFAESERLGKPTLSAHIRLISGEDGFILPIPITRNQRPNGFVYATLAAEDLFSEAVVKKDFRLTVREGKNLVIFAGGPAEGNVAAYAHVEHVQEGLADWDLTVEPTASFLAQNRSSAPLGLLIAGFLITLILWGTLRASALAEWQNARNSEWRKALLNSADYAIVSCDTQGIIQTFNRAAERLLGYPASEVVGLLTPKVFYIEEEVIARRQELERELNRPLERGLEVFVAKAALGLTDEHEWTFRRRDGSLVPTSLSLSALKDAHGEIYGYLGIAIDLTEKKRAQAELQLTHERLERVVEASGEGFWERDFLSREIYFVDQRARHLFGFLPGEKESYERIVRDIPLEDRERLALAIETHVRERTEEFNVEFKIYNQNMGEERWVRALGRVQTTPGQAPRLISTIRDVTDLVRSRERLQAALLKAEEATLAKSAFLASMSHEIRTPLNGVIGMTDVLLGTALSEDQRGYVEIVNQSGNSLLRLINDILDFSKIEAGKMELDEAPFSLIELVENQADILATRAMAAKVVLATFLSPALPNQVYGDASRLGQILLNLMSNAIKFTPKGGIVISVTNVGHAVRFEVRDTGRGIAPENRAKLFRPFVQETNAIAGEFGGTGLGLSISKQFVELMGGAIGVESEVGRGSTFWIELPLRPLISAVAPTLPFASASVIPRALIGDIDPFNAEVIKRYLNAWNVQTVSGDNSMAGAFELAFVGRPARANALRTILIAEIGASLSEDERRRHGVENVLRAPIKRADLIAALKDERAARAPVAAPNAKIAPSGARILVADDNSINRQVARSLLEVLGHQVMLVNDGYEAVAAAGQGAFDLILMDCQMPGMDGYEATREIRRAGNTVPVIALTANAGNEHVEQCYTAGMNAFLTKPIRRDRLAEALAPWLSPKNEAA